MTGLGRRLNALEEIAEQLRRRERHQEVRDEIIRRVKARGLSPAPVELERQVARAIATTDRIDAWAADGLTYDEILGRIAAGVGEPVEVFRARVDAIKQEISRL